MQPTSTAEADPAAGPSRLAGKPTRVDRVDAAVERFCSLYDGRLPLLFIGVVYLANLLLSVWSGRPPAFDDREQLAQATEWAWGYSGIQPPLHTWIVKTIGVVTGDGLAAIYTARFLILFLIVYALSRIGRALKLPPSAVAAGSTGAFLLPQIGWEAQRAYSHSLTAMLFIVFFLLAVLHVMRKQTLGAHLLVGAAAALAILGKYNSLILIAAAGLSAAMLPEARRAFASPKLLAAAALALAILAAPGLWLLNRLDTLDDSAHKFDFESNSSFWIDRLTGSADLIATELTYLGPLIIVAVIGLALHGRREDIRASGAMRRDAGLRFLLVTIGIALVISMVLVVASGATEIKSYWVHPVLIAAPPAVAAILSALNPSQRANRMVVAASLTVALATVVVFVLRLLGAWGL